MNAGQLHRLARVLREAALAATANEGEQPVAASTVAIVEDVTDHPGSPITAIARRTGLAQSLVSRTVDRLQAAGVLTMGRDPSDGRRTLVSVGSRAKDLDFAERGQRPIAMAIRRVAPGLSAEQQRRVESALDVLGDELLDCPSGLPSRAAVVSALPLSALLAAMPAAHRAGRGHHGFLAHLFATSPWLGAVVLVLIVGAAVLLALVKAAGRVLAGTPWYVRLGLLATAGFGVFRLLRQRRQGDFLSR